MRSAEQYGGKRGRRSPTSELAAFPAGTARGSAHVGFGTDSLYRMAFVRRAAPPQSRPPTRCSPRKKCYSPSVMEMTISGPDVAAFWSSHAQFLNFRIWFLDALNSADWEEQPGGKTLLVLYYLERRGTHEELAEMLHVSRATYFRKHRQALEYLADAVFR